MTITREEIERIAALAHLQFEGQELERFAGEFARILEYLETLGGLDLAGIEPTSHAAAIRQPGVESARADKPRPGLPRDESLREAPEQADGHFLVPRFIA